MIGTGANPNIAAVVVIGIEPGWTQRIVDGIAKTASLLPVFQSNRTAISTPLLRRRGQPRNLST